MANSCSELAKLRPAHRTRILAAFLKALAHIEDNITADYVVLQARDPTDFALRGIGRSIGKAT